jgi:hypothetical protein
MDELMFGIQILFDFEFMSSEEREIAARWLDEFRAKRGERGLDLLRAVVRGEIAANDAYEAIYVPLH